MDRCQCLISCIPTNHGLSLLVEVPLPIIALLSPTAFSVFGKSGTPLCTMVQSEPPLLVTVIRCFTAMVITHVKTMSVREQNSMGSILQLTDFYSLDIAGSSVRVTAVQRIKTNVHVDIQPNLRIHEAKR